ncbi:alkaline phosphatase family protein [bacterium]|nr:MAG: alkaline phosphatase family protein [bacterium]
MTYMKNVLFLTLVILTGCSKSATDAKLPIPPKLIVFISIDQFRYDYLTRFAPFFGADGFNHLIKKGANFVNCEYEHATTKTSVGHSVMMSGAYPRTTGIVANNWYDRDLRRLTYSVEDTLSPVLGLIQKSNRDGRSPRKFNGTNLGDALKHHNGNKSKVFAVSCKDDASILMAGRSANAAYWMNDAEGGFFTSSYYMKAFPEWVETFNREHSFDKWFGAKWDLLLGEKDYPMIDISALRYYDYPKSWSGTLPYQIGISLEKPDADYYNLLIESPFSSEALLDFTERLTVEEELGADEFPDILCISFSANDEIGHCFGPNSREVMDVTIRTDRYLERLFKFMDKAVGDEHILYVLTSDHGVAVMPEELKRLEIESGRVKPPVIEKLVQEAMTKKFGKLDVESSYVGRMANLDFYFNRSALDEKKIDKKAAEDYISQVLTKSMPQIFRVYTAEHLMHGNISQDTVLRLVQNNYHTENSGDLVIILKPNFVWDRNEVGTEHGSPYSYDRHVPLILYGTNWIKPGNFGTPCSPADIAPTLSTIFGIDAPVGFEGKILKEVIRFSK